MVPHFGNCSGDLGTGLAGTAIIASYLLLFVKFFNRTYTKNAQAKMPHHSSARARMDGMSSGSLLLRVDSSKFLDATDALVLTTST